MSQYKMHLMGNGIIFLLGLNFAEITKIHNVASSTFIILKYYCVMQAQLTLQVLSIVSKSPLKN